MSSPALAFGRVPLRHDIQFWLCPQVDWPGPHRSEEGGGGGGGGGGERVGRAECLRVQALETERPAFKSQVGLLLYDPGPQVPIKSLQ